MCHAKKKTVILIISLLSISLIVAVSIFFFQKKSQSQSNSNDSQKSTEKEKEIEKIKSRLQELEKKLTAEANLVEKQKFQTEINQLKQQLANLKNGNNPNYSPLPNHNPPAPNPPSLPENNDNIIISPPPANPPANKTKMQIKISYFEELEGIHLYINNERSHDGGKIRNINIAAQNPIFSDPRFTKRGQEFIITFFAEEARKMVRWSEKHKPKPEPCHWYFDKNNTNFTLVPVSAPEKTPTNKEIETELQFNGSLSDNYWLLVPKNNPEKKYFHIAKHHPIFKGKKIEHNGSTFKLTYSKAEAWKDCEKPRGENEYYFSRGNKTFSLEPNNGSWPDDPSNDWPEPPLIEKTVQFYAKNNFGDYTAYIFDNLKEAGNWQGKINFAIDIRHPAIKNLPSEKELKLGGQDFLIRYRWVDYKWGSTWEFDKFNDGLEISQV